MSYLRVLPRDLFNEGKLLKCFGRLSLLVHDAMVPLPMEIEYDGEAFDIALMPEGSLTIINLRVLVDGVERRFKTTYNSRGEYPMFVEIDDEDIEVFDDQGEFTEEFVSAAGGGTLMPRCGKEDE